MLHNNKAHYLWENKMMGNQETATKNNDVIRIGEYIIKNYPPREDDREEDELLQKMEEQEEMGRWFFDNRGTTTMLVMTNLPATERVFVTINEMAKILGIGHNSIRRLVRENPNAEYLYWVGTRAYLKREMFTNIMLEQSTI